MSFLYILGLRRCAYFTRVLLKLYPVDLNDSKRAFYKSFLLNFAFSFNSYDYCHAWNIRELGRCRKP